MDKPREWYLTVYGGMVDKVFSTRPLYEHEPSIHVIEKKAYDEVKNHIDSHVKITCCLGAQIPGYGHSRNCLGPSANYSDDLKNIKNKLNDATEFIKNVENFVNAHCDAGPGCELMDLHLLIDNFKEKYPDDKTS